MKVFSTIVLFTISLCSFSQQEELKGYVEDQNSHRPLHGAHVQNLTTKKLVTSALNGTFSLPAEIGDSILITYVGYQSFTASITSPLLEKRLVVSLSSKETVLGDIVVTPFPEYSRFKQMILEIDPPDSSLKINMPNVGKYAFYDPRSAPIERDLAPPTIGIPFDMEGLTKRGKEKKKLQKKLELERKWRLASAKFNRDWVGKITKLQGDELTDFIAYCNFTVDYILETHLIDIKNEVMALLKDFKGSSGKVKNDQYSPGA